MSAATIYGTRHHVFRIYKELLYMGRDWPPGYTQFRNRLHKAFMSQRSIQNEVEIWKRIERAEFVKKELEALYYLKRYRALRRAYSEE